MLLLAAPFLCYALGALLEYALQSSEPTDWAPATLFRRLLVGLCAAGWAGVVLAEVGQFVAWRLALFLLVASGVLWLAGRWRSRRRRGPGRALGSLGPWGARRQRAALGALLALAVALFAQPGEDILGARDPGIYVATGVAIARDGALLQDDPALRALATNLGDASINYWLFQSVHGWPLRFPGQLFVRDLAAGQVEPGFLPWYPTLLAAAVGAAGPAAGLWVNPLLSLLALCAVYLTGRALFGQRVAALGAALLAVNLAQVWFARYTLAEPATQLLVWTGLYALAAMRRRPTLALGALGGLAWGSVCLTRVEAVLLVPPVAAYLAWQTRRPAARAPAVLALGLVALGALHGAWHAARYAPGYATMVFSGATLAVAAGGVALTLVLGALLWLLRPVPAVGPVRARERVAHRRRVVALAALAVLATLFAYAVRPALPLAVAEGEARALETAARESLIRIGWYVTPLGTGLALIGLLLLLWRGSARRATPLLGLLALSLAFYLPNPLVSSDQPWAARRYLPVVFPGLLLLAAYAAVTLGRLAARRRDHCWGRLVALGLAGAIALGEWQATAPVAAYREHAGAVGQIEALAALVPPDAIVLFPRSAAGMRLSLPLHYLGERQAFVLPAEGPVDGVLEVVRRWRVAGRPVYWAVPLGTRFPTPPGYRFAPAGQFTFAVPQLERPLDRLPREADTLRFDLQLYRIELE